MAMIRSFTQVAGGDNTGKVYKDIPNTCDVCGSDENSVIYDARVPSMGQWEWLCEDCFTNLHCSLGVGFGQRYELVERLNSGTKSVQYTYEI